MNRKELAITVVGLIATFALPWPCAEQGPQSEPTARISNSAGEHTRSLPRPRPYGVLERVRTGPLAGLQPTR